MRAIGIRIGHDDDLVIICVLDVEFGPDSGTDRINHGIDFFVFDDVLKFRLFRVQNLAAQRQNCLKLAIASLFGRSAGRIPFD